jgi:DNA topoisomerase VI subunit B
MEPSRSPQATLNDLLDRILDNGILLNTDLIICVSGIPLLGINLKLALAGMETMLQYGIMEDWDEAQRAIANKEEREKKPPLDKDEYVTYSTFGTHWYSKGIYESWRTGMIYITNKRIIMYRKEPAEVLFETFYNNIKAMIIKEKPHFTGIPREELHIMLNNDEVMPLHSIETRELKAAIENIMKEKNISMNSDIIFQDKKQLDFLQSKEELIEEGKMWFLMSSGSENNTTQQWKPGHIYLTNNRLCWWYDFDKKLVVNIETKNIIHGTISGNSIGGSLVGEKSLIIMYKEGNKNNVLCFSGDNDSIEKWNKIVNELAQGNDSEKSMETCPRCGKKENKNILLEKGCSRCGWISYRANRKEYL